MTSLGAVHRVRLIPIVSLVGMLTLMNKINSFPNDAIISLTLITGL